MKEQLTLLSLIIKHKGKILLDIKFNNEAKSNRDTIFTSVIIGTNGEGKSFILSSIANVFKIVEAYINNKEIQPRYDFYSIEFAKNKDIYKINIDKKIITFYCNDVKKDNINTSITVLAASYIPNDKFPYKDDNSSEKISIYEYIGIRQTSNATFINSISKKISNAIIENIDDKNFIDTLKSCIEFLNMQPTVKLLFEPTLKTLFRRGISKDSLRKRLSNLKKTNSMSAYKAANTNEEELKDIISFIKWIRDTQSYVLTQERDALEFEIDFDNQTSSNLLKQIKLIRKMSDLKLLEAPRLILCKNEKSFDFEHCSSGEKQILFITTLIASKIKYDSLVLIDEPEISLHANWQMQYINYIKTIFSKYKGAHFILASHSHYIISDLQKDTSSIIRLEKDVMKDTIEGNIIEHDTYAWSAENILYNIFNVRTTRNYYFELELKELVSIVQNKLSDLERLSFLINKMARYIYDENDPLAFIINEAKEYEHYVKTNK